MKKENLITITKEEYIKEILGLLQNCNKESVFMYIKSFLEKVA